MSNSHPYDMYNSIHEQPTLGLANFEGVDELKVLIDQAERIFLVGTGTSFHAAWSSSFLLRKAYPDKFVQAVNSIDFSNYHNPINENDLVIVFSHRGTKRYSLDSLVRARENGAKSTLITGVQQKLDMNIADLIIQTVEQEPSSAHTISYMASVGVIARICGYDADNLSSLLEESLNSEPQTKKLSKEINNPNKIWVVGSGPAEVIAHEIALKIKETSYIDTEGTGTEELIHGPFQSADAKDLFIVIAPKGQTQDRTHALLQPIRDINATIILITNQPNSDVTNILIEDEDEVLAPFTCLPQLQLLTYYIALESGTNPDSFRLDNPKFKKAFERNSL